jgi:hypothetical protein
VVHPIHLLTGGTLGAWQQRLQQEGRTQPFAQLSREFYTDPNAARLVAGRRVRLGALYERLKRFGWHRDYDYGLYRRIDRNREAALRFRDGSAVDPADSILTVQDLSLYDIEDPVLVSEAVREADLATAAAAADK